MNVSDPAVVLIALVLASCVSGCNGDDDGACTIPLGGCDIRDASCQRDVYAGTACVSGLAAEEIPEIRTLDVAGFEAELREETGEDAPTAMLERWNQALRFLGLLAFDQNLEDGSVEVALDNVAAYYDDEARRVTVIDRGEAGNPEQDAYVLSHEFVHALRDQQTGLRAFLQQNATSTDSVVSLHALVEGEAVVISTDVLSRMSGRSPGDILWDRLSAALFGAIFESIDGSDQPLLTAVQALPYALGASDLGPHWETEGIAAIDALYEAPRLSALAWRGDPPIERLECYPTAPPPGYEALDRDALGLAGVLALPVALGLLDARSSFTLAERTSGDSMVLFAPAGDEASTHAAVAWRVRFASAVDAGEFAQLVGCCLPLGAQAIAIDRDVLLYATSEPELVDGWSDAAYCGSEDELPETSSQMTQGMSILRAGLRLR